MIHATRLVTTILVIALAANTAMAAETVCLKHDDGGQDDKLSITGAGHAIRFDCPDAETWFVEAVAIHGSRYGQPTPPAEKFAVYVTDADMKKTAKSMQPYSLFERGAETWVKFDIVPVEVQGTFQVVAFFNPTKYKGIYIGIDRGGDEAFSTTVVPSTDEAPSEFEGNWMIRAYLTKKPKGQTRSLLDAEARSEEASEEAAQRDAAILGPARSITLKHDDGEMDKYLSINGLAAETVAFETPNDWECYVWEVQMYASAYGSQHDPDEILGDVYILDEQMRPISRTSFPYSRLTQRHQWVDLPTLPTLVKGKFHVVICAHATKYKGFYVGYDEGNSEGSATVTTVGADKFETVPDPGRFADMKWMIRVKVADRPVVYGDEAE